MNAATLTANGIQFAIQGDLNGLRNNENIIDINNISINKSNTSLCTEAARNGHLNCLRYLHQRGWASDISTSTAAAANGHIDCLIFAHEHGCPWNMTTYQSAIAGGHMNCANYLQAN